MTAKEMLLIEANLRKFTGKHFLNEQEKTRYMEYKGVLFKWDADREIYVYADENA